MGASRSRLLPVGAAVLVVVLIAAALSAVLTGSSNGKTPRHPPAGLHVVGNRILDASGHAIQFHGVNRSGTEYACIQGHGVFDGPSDAQSVAAIARWHVNIVRIPLNEDCWLGINGVPASEGGAVYRSAIVHYVKLLHAHGMYAELSLMWAAPGSARATYQDNAPDEDHSPGVWAGMARAFKSDPDVILAPWGETTVNGQCFLHGCSNLATFAATAGPFDGNASCGNNCDLYATAGMDQAVKVMRHAGYHGIISIPGINYANDLSHWLQDEPRDPRHQLIAEAHVYGGNACDTVACFNSTYAPVARRVPLIYGETGESAASTDCGSSAVAAIIDWADAHNIGYEAWTWDAWGNCGGLIRNYTGTPYSAYGSWIKQHFNERRGRLL